MNYYAQYDRITVDDLVGIRDIETVYKPGGGNSNSSRKIHTQEDCRNLQKAKNYAPKPVEVLFGDEEICKTCVIEEELYYCEVCEEEHSDVEKLKKHRRAYEHALELKI